MIIAKIRKRFSEVPAYVVRFRFLYGIRILLTNYLSFPVVIKTLRGSWIFLGADRVDDIILKSFYRMHKDIYFPETDHYGPEDVILDVGGHHGIYAMEMSSLFPDAKIYSFEPDSTSFRYFKFNLSLNTKRNVFLFNAALEKTSGEIFIVKSDEGSWGNYTDTTDVKGAHKVKMLSVDNFLSSQGIKRISLAKFNAEGAEFSILPALFELHCYPEKILLFGHPERGDLAGLVDTIRANGYKILQEGDSLKRPWYQFSRS